MNHPQAKNFPPAEYVLNGKTGRGVHGVAFTGREGGLTFTVIGADHYSAIRAASRAFALEMDPAGGQEVVILSRRSFEQLAAAALSASSPVLPAVPGTAPHRAP